MLTFLRETFNDIPASVQSDLRLSDAIHMVVMDFIDAQPNPPPDARRQIMRAFESNGCVIGNLREPSILFDTDGKAKFINFHWCGRYDMKFRDKGLADERQEQLEYMEYVQIRDGPCAYYPLEMEIMIEGMWAPGMEALNQILTWTRLDEAPMVVTFVVGRAL